MKKIFGRPLSMTNNRYFYYCSGCGHGIVHRVICEVVDELNIREELIGIAPVGCAVCAYDYWDFDVSEAPHGRPPAVATGIKRVLPDKIVFTYQGDGDLAAIGIAETIHTALRGENITIIFINNGVYGMTGGQMAPTTLIGQKTATTPIGRKLDKEGHPIKICELLKDFETVKYLARTTVTNPKNILKTKISIKKAFLTQINNLGFSLVEVLSPCPVSWELSPKRALQWIEQVFCKYYPLGEIKTWN